MVQEETNGIVAGKNATCTKQPSIGFALRREHPKVVSE
jgi:hypothetical protein